MKQAAECLIDAGNAHYSHHQGHGGTRMAANAAEAALKEAPTYPRPLLSIEVQPQANRRRT